MKNPLYDFNDSVAAIAEALSKRQSVASVNDQKAIDNTLLELISHTLQSMQVTYETKVRDLEDTLEEYKAADIDFDFATGWDKDISRITIILYIIEAREEIGRCQYCDGFRDRGWDDKLMNLWEELNIVEHKFRFKIVVVDPVDRMFNSSTSPFYTNKLTKEGENFYISKALFMRTYPSVILKVKFYDGKVVKYDPIWEMIEGVGRTREGKIVYSAINEKIKLYLKDHDEKHLQDIVKHKSEKHYTDYVKERKKNPK